jgi:hypothetical protein
MTTPGCFGVLHGTSSDPGLCRSGPLLQSGYNSSVCDRSRHRHRWDDHSLADPSAARRIRRVCPDSRARARGPVRCHHAIPVQRNGSWPTRNACSRGGKHVELSFWIECCRALPKHESGIIALCGLVLPAWRSHYALFPPARHSVVSARRARVDVDLLNLPAARIPRWSGAAGTRV